MPTNSQLGSDGVTLTIDVESFAAPGRASRHVELTYEILEELDRRKWTASFFIVGEVADAEPDLVRAIAANGHEIGLHAHRHIAIANVGEADFLQATRAAKESLESLIGIPVLGYRAPMMSLVPETHWAIPMLQELDFQYSSSVLPAKSPHFGWPGLPARPFRWRDGPIELPCPVVRAGSVGLPFLGGTYLRLLPAPVVRTFQRMTADEQLQWSYCHPYEFDPAEPRWTDPSVGKAGSWMLWYGRRHTWRNLERVSRRGIGLTLAERIATLPEVLPIIDPRVAAVRN